MSYILEALKKSEQERERGNVPDLQSIHQAPLPDAGRSHAVWYIILVSIILAGGITMAWRTYMPQQAELIQVVPAPTADTPATPSIAPPVVANTGRQVQPPPVTAKPDSSSALEKTAPVKSTTTAGAASISASASKPSSNVVFLDQEIPADQMYSRNPLDMPDNQAEGDNSSAELQQSTSSGDALIAKSSSQQATRQRSSTSTDTGLSAQQGGQKDDIPNLANLPSSMQKGIPDISFSGHVYNSVPQRRSVIINDKFLREGEYVTQDIKLMEITDRGAIFRYQDTLFRLGALQDWSRR